MYNYVELRFKLELKEEFHMFCKKCGANVPDSTSFCPNCGEDLRVPQPTQPQQPIQQPQQQYQAYQQPYQTANFAKPATPGKGFGITGMILGFGAINWVFWWFLCIPFGIASIIFSAVGLSKAAQVKGRNGMAVTGIVCSSIAIVCSLVVTIILIFFPAAWIGFWSGFGI